MRLVDARGLLPKAIPVFGARNRANLEPPDAGAAGAWQAGAVLLYAATAFICLDHGASLTRNIATAGADPYNFIWFLKWWPWAIGHHVDPFHTDLVWHPAGIYTLWFASIPFLAALMLPATLLGGPVLSYNLLVILGPVVSGWCTYRLCLRLTGDPAAAVIGGFLFGFSPYAMLLEQAAPNLADAWSVPLLAWTAVVRFEGGMRRARAVTLASLLLVAQFLTSLEIAATLVLFSGLAWALAYAWLPDWRGGLRRLLVDAAGAALAVAVLLAPFFMALAAHRHFLKIPWYWAYWYSQDGLAIIGFGHVRGQFPELSNVLLLVILGFAWEARARPAARWLLALMGILLLASLGPRLWLGGRMTGGVLPWALVTRMPLLNAALPVRFSLYVRLIAAIIAALWIAGGRYRWARLGLGALACAVLLPGLRPLAPVPHAAFFAPGRIESVLGPRPRVLILPFAVNGAGTYWQQENNFGFAQTGGYLGPPPAAEINNPAVVQLFDNVMNGSFLSDFKTFCWASGTQYVVAGPGTPAAELSALARLGWRTAQVDDVTVLTVPPAPAQVKHG